MPDRSFSKEILPNTQSKPPLMQLEAIASKIWKASRICMSTEKNGMLDCARSSNSAKAKAGTNEWEKGGGLHLFPPKNPDP